MFQLLSIVCYLVLGGYCLAEWGFSLVGAFCLALFGTLFQLACFIIYILLLEDDASKFTPLASLNLLAWFSWGIGVLIYSLVTDFPFWLAFIVVFFVMFFGLFLFVLATPGIEWQGFIVHIDNPELKEIRDELKAIHTDLKHARDNQKAD